MKSSAFLVVLCACTAQQPAPTPAPAPAPEPAATVYVVPEVVVLGERVRPHREAETEPVRERVFCDQWANGVICDSYPY